MKQKPHDTLDENGRPGTAMPETGDTGAEHWAGPSTGLRAGEPPCEPSASVGPAGAAASPFVIYAGTAGPETARDRPRAFGPGRRIYRADAGG